MHGAEVDDRDSEGWTPLQMAVWKGHTTVASLLINCGADIEARDNKQCTALHFASLTGEHVDCAKLLLLHGAEVDARDDAQYTPLLRAADPFNRRRAALIELLMGWLAEFLL